jgi:hypothetical protein
VGFCSDPASKLKLLAGTWVQCPNKMYLLNGNLVLMINYRLKYGQKTNSIAMQNDNIQFSLLVTQYAIKEA